MRQIFDSEPYRGTLRLEATHKLSSLKQPSGKKKVPQKSSRGIRSKDKTQLYVLFLISLICSTRAACTITTPWNSATTAFQSSLLNIGVGDSVTQDADGTTWVEFKIPQFDTQSSTLSDECGSFNYWCIDNAAGNTYCAPTLSENNIHPNGHLYADGLQNSDRSDKDNSASKLKVKTNDRLQGNNFWIKQKGPGVGSGVVELWLGPLYAQVDCRISKVGSFQVPSYTCVTMDQTKSNSDFYNVQFPKNSNTNGKSTSDCTLSFKLYSDSGASSEFSTAQLQVDPVSASSSTANIKVKYNTAALHEFYVKAYISPTYSTQEKISTSSYKIRVNDECRTPSTDSGTDNYWCTAQNTCRKWDSANQYWPTDALSKKTNCQTLCGMTHSGTIDTKCNNHATDCMMYDCSSTNLNTLTLNYDAGAGNKLVGDGQLTFYAPTETKCPLQSCSLDGSPSGVSYDSGTKKLTLTDSEFTGTERTGTFTVNCNFKQYGTQETKSKAQNYKFTKKPQSGSSGNYCTSKTECSQFDQGAGTWSSPATQCVNQCKGISPTSLTINTACNTLSCKSCSGATLKSLGNIVYDRSQGIQLLGDGQLSYFLESSDQDCPIQSCALQGSPVGVTFDSFTKKLKFAIPSTLNQQEYTGSFTMVCTIEHTNHQIQKTHQYKFTGYDCSQVAMKSVNSEFEQNTLPNPLFEVIDDKAACPIQSCQATFQCKNCFSFENNKLTVKTDSVSGWREKVSVACTVKDSDSTTNTLSKDYHFTVYGCTGDKCPIGYRADNWCTSKTLCRKFDGLNWISPALSSECENLCSKFEEGKISISCTDSQSCQMFPKSEVSEPQNEEPPTVEQKVNPVEQKVNFPPRFEQPPPMELKVDSDSELVYTYESPTIKDAEGDSISIEVTGYEQSKCQCISIITTSNNFKIKVDRAKISQSETINLEVTYSDNVSDVKNPILKMNMALNFLKKEEIESEITQESAIVESNSTQVANKTENLNETERVQELEKEISCQPEDISCLQDKVEQIEQMTQESSNSQEESSIRKVDQKKLDYINNMLFMQGKGPKNVKDDKKKKKKEEQEPPKILAAWIKSIDQVGELQVQFNDTLDYELIPAKEKLGEKYIQMTIIPSHDINETLLEFHWHLEEFDKTTNIFKFKIHFESPLYISTGPELDTFQIRFKQPWTFQSKKTGLFIDQQFVKIKTSIGKQMVENAATVALFDSTKYAIGTLENSTVMLFISQIAFKSAAKKLLGTLVLIQIIIFLAILRFEYPGNVIFFLSQIKPIISFDILKILGNLNQYIFTFDTANQKKEMEYVLISPLKDMGIQYSNIILNLGLLGQIIALLLFQAIFLLPFLMLLAKMLKFTWLQNKVDAQIKKVYFGQFVAVITKGLMPISVALYINITCPITTTSGEILGLVYTGIIAFLVIMLLVLIIITVIVPRETLQHPKFKQILGPIYSKIRTETRYQRLYPLIFILRRLTLVAIGLFLYEHSGQQPQVLLLSYLLMIIYCSNNEVLPSRHKRLVNNINEFIMLCICYNLFFFSEWVPEKEQQYQLGFTFILALSGMLIFNSSFVVKALFKSLRLKIKQAIKKYKRKKNLRMQQNNVKPTQSQAVPSQKSKMPVKNRKISIFKIDKTENPKQKSTMNRFKMNRNNTSSLEDKANHKQQLIKRNTHLVPQLDPIMELPNEEGPSNLLNLDDVEELIHEILTEKYANPKLSQDISEMMDKENEPQIGP